MKNVSRHILLLAVAIFCSLGLSCDLLGQDTTKTPSVPSSIFPKIKKVKSNVIEPRYLKRMINSSFRGIKDTVSMEEVKASLAQRIMEKGYPEFSIDAMKREGQTLALTIHRGPKYFHEKIDLSPLNTQEYNKAGFSKLVKRKAPFNLLDFESKLAGYLDEFQNKGYPYAKFDSIEAAYRRPVPDSVYTHFSYKFSPGNLVRIDSIIFEGKKRERDRFVQSLIGMREGDFFDNQAIENIPKALNNSIYYRNVKPPIVEFDEDKVKVRVKMEKRKTGKFDLLLGLLPPRTGEGSKFQFTGLVDFQLVSPIFKAGEILQLRYDKLIGSSQKLHVEYSHPYIAGTPLKGQVEFDMLKQDTSFLNLWFKVSGFYAFTTNLSVRVWYKNRSSSLISTTAYEGDSTASPPVLDGRDNVYGLGLLFQNLDYNYNPTKGFYIRADFGLGRKKVRKNPKIHENVYEDLELIVPKAEADFEIHWYQKLFKRQVLHLSNRTYWLDQKQFFENDLQQIGGARSVRGFNENQFFSNFFTLFSLEYRYLLERNSFLFVFGDYARMENVLSEDRVLHPVGIGVGMTYETKVGMISLSYAIGQVGDFPFQPSRGRIHVGFVNQF